MNLYVKFLYAVQASNHEDLLARSPGILRVGFKVVLPCPVVCRLQLARVFEHGCARPSERTIIL